MLNRNRRIPRSVLALAVAMPALPVLADELDFEIEEIVVTATKRTTALSDTGMSISALNNRTLTEMGATNFQDFLRTIPGVNFTPGNAPGEQDVVVRGVNFPSNRFMQPTVGVYVDEVALSQNGRNPDLDLIDIERVEVLRGPQGTLYGSSSMGGTLRYITYKPTTGGIESNVSASLEDTDEGGLGYRVNGMVNLPLGDTLAVRAVAYYRDLDGWIDNIGWANTLTGYTPIDASLAEKDVNTEEVMGGRLALRWEPHSDWTVDFNYLFHETDIGGLYTHNPNIGEFKQAVRIQEEKNDDLDVFNLSISWQAPLGQLLWVTAWSERDYTRFDDLSRVPQGFDWWVGDFSDAYDRTCDCFTDAGGNLAGHAYRDRPISWELITHELRWSGDEGPFHWVGGIYYSEADNNWKQAEVYPGAGADFAPFVPFNFPLDFNSYEAASLDPSVNLERGKYPAELYGMLGTDVWFSSDRDETIEQLALYGNFTFDITDRLDATIGYRWFDTTIENDYVLGGVFAGVNVLAADDTDPGFVNLVLNEVANNYETTGSPKADESGNQILLSTSFDITDDAMLYLTFAEGYRIGGINRVIPVRSGDDPPPTSFDSDQLESLEFGWKTAWFSNKLRFTGSVFLIDWENIQLSVTEATTSFDYVINAGEAEVKGFESELQWLVTSGLDVRLGVTLVDHELTEVPSTAIDGGFDGEEGDELPLVSNEAFYLMGRYQFALNNSMDAYVRGDWIYTGSTQTDLNRASRHYFQIDSFAVVNLRAGIYSGPWEVALFAQNATNEDTITSQEQRPRFRPEESGRVTSLKPRTVGINFNWTF